MTRRFAFAGIACAVYGAAVLFACARSPAPPTRTALSEDLTREVEDGAKAQASLESFGRFETDARYGTHWCPREPPAGEARPEPYRNYGHFAPQDDGARWVSARPATWLETTTLAGWWVYRQASDEWCWVPGLAKAAARLAWRSGMGYVGWAPLPPDGRVEQVPGAAWTYTLLGLLYEPWLTTLAGDARGDAMFATAPRSGMPAMSLRAPTQDEVRAAREPLVLQARAAAIAEGNELPPAQALWALVTKASASGAKPGETTASQAPPATPKLPFSIPGVPGLGMDGLQGIDPAMLDKLLGDGGLPPGLSGLPGLPKR